MKAPLSIALIVFGATAETRDIVAELTREELEQEQKRARNWLDAFQKREK